MTTEQKIIDSLDKLPEEKKTILFPSLKKFIKLANTNKELFESEQNFFIQFTGIVGVVFGVLAAFSNVGENKVADIVYFVGTSFCLVCLVLCIICLFQPTHKLQNKLVQNSIDFVNDFSKAASKISGEQFDMLEVKGKYSPNFKLLRISAYVCFCISLACLFARHIILLISAYCS